MGGSVLVDFGRTFDDKKLLVLFGIVVSIILIDSEVGVVSDFIPETISSNAGILLFIGSAILFAITGFFILSHIKQIGIKGGAKILSLGKSHTLVTVVHCTLIGIITFVILQILFTSQYNTLAIALTIAISYGLWIIMVLLARAFYSWYKSIASRSESQQNIDFDTDCFYGCLCRKWCFSSRKLSCVDTSVSNNFIFKCGFFPGF